MRINFRQGLIGYQQSSGTPTFLQASSTPGYVSQIVSPTKTIVTFAHGDADYLQVFDTTVDLAWGPAVTGSTNYLYWDIDLLTADVTRGLTVLAPVISLSAPSSPAHDQHWFDLSTNTMRVWNAGSSSWQQKVRVFAGSLTNGSTGSIVPNMVGTQVGLDVPANPGFIMEDSLLRPLRMSDGSFLTDASAVHVNTSAGTAGVLVQQAAHVVPVRAAETIPVMSMVYFSDNDIVRLASSNPALMPARVPVGLMLDALATGDLGTLVTSGEVTYDQWDFEGHAGEPLYIDTNGALTLTRLRRSNAHRA